MKQLFEHSISNWDEWSNVYQNIEAWQPLIKDIYELEGLPLVQIEHLVPGTNAVFKLGNTVVKIFAPKESGMDAQEDYNTELFGLRRANKLGVLAPELIANGCVYDKYDFLYLIMEHIDGNNLSDIEEYLTDCDKEKIGRKLREITDKLNTPCREFNNIDVVLRAIENKRWDIFPERFKKERADYLRQLRIRDKVYVHGDLHCDNVFLDADKNVYIIDFADALLAPAEYEIAALCGMFDYQDSYMHGYFGVNYCKNQIAEEYFKGVLLHDFGADIIKSSLGNIDEITDLDDLKNRICEILK